MPAIVKVVFFAAVSGMAGHLSPGSRPQTTKDKAGAEYSI